MTVMTEKKPDSIIASIVVPVLNEEKYIENFIKSLLKQDYPQDKMEWIFVDGNSNDKTVDIIGKYIQQYPGLIRLLNNSNKTAPYAMNIGIRASTGKYIIRLDAHSEYPENYISKCVHYLDTTDADNVGGYIITRSKGYVGNTIAMMLSSRFGVGNSRFRINGESGYVDTVPFGAFRREVFEKHGLYDERLSRSEDNEMNFRIRKNGGKIYLAGDIYLYYYCRDNIRDLVKMAFANGKWNIAAMKLCPGSMGLRHFVPLFFVLSLLIMPFLSLVSSVFKYLFYTEIILYIILDILFSLLAAREKKYLLLLPVMFPLFHISYGVGSLAGLFQFVILNNYR